MTFRNYIADTLFYKGENKRLTSRFIDVLNPKEEEEIDAQEIIESTIKKIGLKFSED